MHPSIGINPISWSNDDLQYVGGDISLETCLREARHSGYQGIELGNKFPREARVLKPILDEHQLELVSGWYSSHLLSQDAKQEASNMASHAGLLRDMGCGVVIVAEVSGCIHSQPAKRLSQRPRLKHADWKRFGQRLSELGKIAADQGLKLVYHHHMGTVVQSVQDIDALMSATSDDVWLLLDSGHAMFAGANPVALAQTYTDRIGHVHCKDIRRSMLDVCLNRDCSFLDAVLDGVFTVPGDGCVDFEALLSVLSNVGYSGWVVVEAEQDPSVSPPFRYAQIGQQFLASAINQAYS